MIWIGTYCCQNIKFSTQSAMWLCLQEPRGVSPPWQSGLGVGRYTGVSAGIFLGKFNRVLEGPLACGYPLGWVVWVRTGDLLVVDYLGHAVSKVAIWPIPNMSPSSVLSIGSSIFSQSNSLKSNVSPDFGFVTKWPLEFCCQIESPGFQKRNRGIIYA